MRITRTDLALALTGAGLLGLVGVVALRAPAPPPDVVRRPLAPSPSDVSSADTDGVAVRPGRRVAKPVPGTDPTAPVSAATDDGEAGATPVDRMGDWRACFHEAAVEESVRACLRGRLGADELAPDALADLVLADGELDAQERVLVTEAAASWPPAAFPAHMNAFEARSGSLDELWRELFERQRARDPAWCTELALALGPDALFDGEAGTALFAFVAAEAAAGDAGLRALLERGALGALGGTDAQVAAAIAATCELRASSAARLDHIEAVLSAPGFAGREFETDAVLGLLLDARSFEEGDPTRALDLTRRMLRDPRLGPGTAEHLLVLWDWCKVPGAVSSDQQADLLELARDVHGDGE